MKWFVGITTYNRPKLLRQLLQQIAAQPEKNDVLVRVVDDASPCALPTKLIESNGWALESMPDRCGKKGFWRVYSRLLERFEESDCARFVSLPDDCRICAHFFKWVDAYLSLRGVSCLSLHRDLGARSMHGCWDSGPPTLVNKRRALPLVVGPPAGVPPVRMGLELCGWVDGFTAMRRAAAAKLEFRVKRVSRPWKRAPHLGSGVGEQITRRLRRAKVPIHRPTRSLVRHLGVPSEMNPEARVHHPLATADFIDDPAQPSRAQPRTLARWGTKK